MSTDRLKPRGRPISTIAGVLRRALKLIQNGWVKGTLNTEGQRGRRCYCAVGGICKAAPNLRLEAQALATLRGVVGEPIPSWNDRPGRTKPEVVQAFKKAIRLAA